MLMKLAGAVTVVTLASVIAGMFYFERRRRHRLGGDAAGSGEVALAVDDSLWVDGEGRPHATHQLVIEGLTSRGGGQFSWLFKKMG